jgi:hypothetical protein
MLDGQYRCRYSGAVCAMIPQPYPGRIAKAIRRHWRLGLCPFGNRVPFARSDTNDTTRALGI